MSKMFEGKTLANFDPKKQPAAYKLIKGYDLIGGSSIILSGNYGTGKTHLAFALLDRYIKEWPATGENHWGIKYERSFPVHFTNENRLLSRIRMTYQDGAGENEEQIYGQLRTCELLIIDDVGKVKPRDYNFLQGVYFRIIDDRYNDKRAVLLTTNFSLSELDAHIGGASSDRLNEMAGKNMVVMAGKSQRQGNVSTK